MTSQQGHRPDLGQLPLALEQIVFTHNEVFIFGRRMQHKTKGEAGLTLIFLGVKVKSGFHANYVIDFEELCSLSRSERQTSLREKRLIEL
jgi:hypothetical protein